MVFEEDTSADNRVDHFRRSCDYFYRVCSICENMRHFTALFVLPLFLHAADGSTHIHNPGSWAAVNKRYLNDQQRVSVVCGCDVCLRICAGVDNGDVLDVCECKANIDLRVQREILFGNGECSEHRSDGIRQPTQSRI